MSMTELRSDWLIGYYAFGRDKFSAKTIFVKTFSSERIDSEGLYGRWRLWVMGSWYYLVHYINILMATFLTNFLRFPNNFRRAPKTPRKLSEDQANISEQFLKTYEHCRRFPIITEDFREKTDDVSSIEQHIEVLLKGLCNHSNGKLFGFWN